jgi:parallel beta-helix repeat protein
MKNLSTFILLCSCFSALSQTAKKTTIKAVVVPPSFSVTDVTINEAAGAAVFTVVKTGKTTLVTKVNYTTASGTATADVDFTSQAGLISFQPQDVTHTISVPIINDAWADPSEQFYVNLSTPVNATISKAQGVCTIIDDDTSTGTVPGGGDTPQPVTLPVVAYYFSDANGNDTRSASTAQNPATPWKTTAALQTFLNSGGSMVAGAHLRFMDGKYGPSMLAFNLVPMVIAVNSEKGWQGTVADPIVIENYNGSHPVFTSLVAATAPTSMAGSGYNNVWAYNVSPWEEITSVYIDGVMTPVARSPKRTETGQRGYLMGKSITGYGYRNFDTMTTSSANIPPQNIVGADVVFKNNHYVVTAHKIVGQTATKIAFRNSSETSVETDYGWFYENHISFLSQNGEWAYDRTNHKLYVYWSDNTPANHSAEYATTNYLVWALGGKNIIFDGIEFKGANVHGILVQGMDRLTVQNCTMAGMGRCGIWSVNGATNTVVYKNTIKDCYVSAVDLGTELNCRVEANDISNISMALGGQRWTTNSGDNGAGKIENFVEATNGGAAVVVAGNDGLILDNKIAYTGYNSVVTGGQRSNVLRNSIFMSTMNTMDGSGIYSFGKAAPYAQFNSSNKRTIRYNTVICGPGDPGGTLSLSYRPTYGVYLDDESVYFDVLDNTISDAQDAGIYLHHTQNITVSRNTIYNSNNAYFTRFGDNGSQLLPLNNNISGNLAVAAAAGQADSSLTVINQGVFSSLTPSQTATFSGNLFFGYNPLKETKLIYNSALVPMVVPYTGGPYTNIVSGSALAASPALLPAYSSVVGIK